MRTIAGNHPDSDTVRAALGLAVRAPSLHNTQPWQWRVGGPTVHLYGDPDRYLPMTDPDGREMLLSCDAALHHLRIAAESLGWRTKVRRLPNPAEPEHLAGIEFSAATPTSEVITLAKAIAHRRTDRRRVTSWEVPAAHLRAMIAAGCAEGAFITEIPGGPTRIRLVEACTAAARAHAADAGYRSELIAWSGRHAATDGVPARNAVAPADPMTREFRAHTMSEPPLCDLADHGALLLVHTTADDHLSRLRAGEAASAVLLRATALGLATCPLTEPLELPGTRELVAEDILPDSGFPQMIIRIGWAATSSPPIPPTPRRPLAEVVAPMG
ncbi:NAD(P)H nitroreductase [Nocardia panacis]|uniref:NAD(P)H nitroreductase n=1 Tax=Nocardia panacis TaxID=2340916 RepID=A0A3A4KM78_9NOCA|nr:NAD(P)H nitroreductase [Nocardia panacis]RJO74124.1 NAD(P)H nitroreductase [Nocardia panacis]